MFVPEKITLHIRTRELLHQYYKKFENDPDIFMDMSLYTRYEYNEANVDRYYDSKRGSDRVTFMIMHEGKPIGEVGLKGIDYERKECTLSIHMQNDSVKGLGYGTQAERLALQYAFDQLGMAAVNADVVLKNTRSQHVLEKVGFQFVKEEGIFRYYRCEKAVFERR